MPLPANDSNTRRGTLLGAILTALLVVPTLLGFAAADAGESRPPTAEEDAAGPIGTRILSEQDQADLIARAPLSNAPSSAQDALTRQGGNEVGIARITFISEDTGSLRVENGGSVSLAGGYSIRVTVDPYPPSTFKLNIQLEVLKDGEPVPDATIDTVWDMTVMPHGPFETRFDPAGNGVYSSSFDFFMFGPWFVDASMAAPGLDPTAFRLQIYVWPA